MKKILLSYLALCFVFSAFSQKHEKYTLVINNINIVDVAGNRILANKVIAVSGDTIKAVDDNKNRGKYKATHYVNGGHRYIMPGLWDMHVHLRGGNDMIDANKKLLKLFYAYGVTTVRECGGDITPSIMEWKKQTADGKIEGPRIFTSGPTLDGPKPTWAGSLLVETPHQVSKALDSLQSIHTEFVKVDESKIAREAYLEALT